MTRYVVRQACAVPLEIDGRTETVRLDPAELPDGVDIVIGDDIPLRFAQGLHGPIIRATYTGPALRAFEGLDRKAKAERAALDAQPQPDPIVGFCAELIERQRRIDEAHSMTGHGG
jgi:hypothetical protein